jgi:cytosine/adenosine deaminase-related metal-dependent hydrolase
MVDAAIEKLRSVPGNAAGLSPHAPYSTTPELLRATSKAAREFNLLLTTHVAESADEFAMYRQARGAMFNWLKPQRDMSDCGNGSPVGYLAREGLLAQNFLAVHANYLASGDATLLAQSGCSVVHCPRSHAFFRHRKFPLPELKKSGVNICLGTDSLATIAKSRTEPLALDMFSEMRAFARNFPGLSAGQLLRSATVNAALALHREHELGVIAPNASADLIAVPFSGRAPDAAEAVIHYRSDVAASMICGRWAINPPGL